jgi:hypothetical protein
MHHAKSKHSNVDELSINLVELCKRRKISIRKYNTMNGCNKFKKWKKLVG